MARRKDLTALAALGTLGYMLSKRGDKKDDKKAETPSLENLPVARPSMKPNPLIAAGEEQGKTKGSGDAYMAEYYAKKERSPEAIQEADNPRVSSPASKPAARKPVVKSRPMSPAMDASMQEANVGSPITRAEYDMGISNVPRRNSYYKKGGSVKKMASGGMTSSASKRADGIATRGKTKCKMY
jgi:hypothetical protein